MVETSSKTIPFKSFLSNHLLRSPEKVSIAGMILGAAVGTLVGEAVGESVGASVGAATGGPVGASIRGLVVVTIGALVSLNTRRAGKY